MVIELLTRVGTETGILSMMNSAWAWPIAESIHFMGLCLLVGTVGLFDLRMLGVGRSIPMAALHGLIPFGVAGFGVNVLSGLLFLVSAPDQYTYNPAFQMKLAFMTTAALNMLLFYRLEIVNVRLTAAGAPAPFRARIMAAVSLLCWALVIVAGRLITVFRPPYHWCPWC